jgi:hypothetical protein
MAKNKKTAKKRAKAKTRSSKKEGVFGPQFGPPPKPKKGGA